GRIKHHLMTNISRKGCTILFVGYQATGTLGRFLVDGASEVRILGGMHEVGARIEQINGLSAHADRDELFRWLSSLKKPPRHVFVVHGEPESVSQFTDFLSDRTGWNITAPEYRDEVILE
ncbi:MAG: MBL fold metallo-hydrolase, partial [Dehalococcoidia bacterium]